MIINLDCVQTALALDICVVVSERDAIAFLLFISLHWSGKVVRLVPFKVKAEY